MILVDERAGSKGTMHQNMDSIDPDRLNYRALYALLRDRGQPAQLTRLDYGDVSFLGAGPDDEPIPVGVEIKTIRDLVNGIATGRFAGHQLPGLVQCYEQVWLLVVGLWRSNSKTGILEYRRTRGDWHAVTSGSRQFLYRDLATWLFTMQIKGGISVARSSDWNEATTWLCTMYQWWVKGWTEHKSHLVFHDGTRNGTPYRRERAAQMVAGLADKALLMRPSLCRMVAAQLPGIGWEKSKTITAKYKTVACPYCPPCGHDALASATEEALQALDGLGPKLARGVYESLRSAK